MSPARTLPGRMPPDPLEPNLDLPEIGPTLSVDLNPPTAAPRRTHLELMPMDDTPRRPTVPPCRKRPTEPCGLLMFVLLIALGGAVGAFALAGVAWGVGQLMAVGVEAAVGAAKTLLPVLHHG